MAATIACMAGFAYAENGISLKITDKAVPDDIEDEIKEAVAPKAYELSDGDGTFYEFWFVPALTASAFGDTAKDTLNNVEEISLLGVAVVSRDDHHDFRDDPVDPGTYIVRLALQPKDGNHMGTAPFDTFAILVPAETDSELKKFHDHEMMVELASENTVAEHPPILSLQPFDEAGGDVPRLEFDEEDEWRFLMMQFPVEAGGESRPLTVGLVIEGVGEL
jgi:hypothetical protein